jgi:2',3'-cyclic-nucleotide 2'-phosphodiesterase (5'-nucleotidase family)
LRAKTEQPLLVVDAGNLLFKTALTRGNAAKDNNAAALIIAHGIVRAYAVMAYDAVAISAKDLSAGPEFFRRTTAQSFPWVAANIVDQNATAVFPAHRIKKFADLTLGIIGLTGGAGDDVAGFVIDDWRPALRSEISALEKSCDILLVLSTLTPTENNEIQREYSQIDIIVSANDQAANIQPQGLRNGLLVQSGSHGKYIGKLDVTGHGRGNWYTAPLPSPAERQTRLAAIDRQLNQLEQEQHNNNRDYTQKIARLQAYRQRLSNQIAQQIQENRDSTMQESKRFTYSTLAVRPMTSSASIQTIVQDIKTSISAVNRYRRAGIQANDPALLYALQKNEIAGSSVCRHCHEKQTAFWQTTRHAGAFSTLAEQGQSFNLQCLPCHVTAGRVRASSADAEQLFLLSLDTDRQTIGCEVCHGPGNNHLLSPETTTPPRLPPEEICLQCHTPERDSAFDYPKKVAAIACPAD